MFNQSFTKENVEALIAGDQRAFSLLFDQYSPKLYAFARKLTRSETLAEEAVQEVFLNIWRYRARLLDVEQLEAYFVRMTRNSCFNILRSQAKAWEQLDNPQDDRFYIDNSTIQDLEYKEGNGIIAQAMANLSPKQLEVYQLCRIEGLTYQQAADKLNISSNTVHFHMKEALKHIRTILINSGFPAFIIALLFK